MFSSASMSQNPKLTVNLIPSIETTKCQNFTIWEFMEMFTHRPNASIQFTCWIVYMSLGISDDNIVKSIVCCRWYVCCDDNAHNMFSNYP